MIPESKVAGVDRGLRQAFGVPAFETIQLLTGGLSSALVYRMVVDGKPYLLRIVMRADGFNDPARQYICMRLAADAGLAPRVWYSNAEDAVSITDFVPAAPLPPDPVPALVKMIQGIHALPPFPKLVSYLDGMDFLIRRFHESGLLPAAVTEEHFRYYAEIQKTYPRHDADLVSSHNDLNPNNVLFDGQRLWAVGWEAAFLNDRYVDLAIVANMFFVSEEREDWFLREYFGESPDDYKRARFLLMRQVCRIFYALAFLNLATASRVDGAPVDTGMETPPLREIFAGIGSGKVALGSHEGQLMFGKAMLNAALSAMKSLRFSRSLELMI
jgi:hypothetical protein